MESFQKQSGEAFVVAGNFASVLNTGESINLTNSLVTAVVKKTGVDATTEVIETGTKTVDNALLKAQVKGGTSGVAYKITFFAETDATPPNKWEIDVQMKVKDI